MKGKISAVLLMVLAFTVLAVSPALGAGPYTIVAEDSVNLTDIPVNLNGDNNYGYLQVDSVDIVLNNMDADITVTYRIEPWLSFLVYLFGKDDLKTRVLGVLQYPEQGYNQQTIFKYLDTNRAVIHVTNAALDNQDNSYWFKAHTFGCTVPKLNFVFSDTDVRRFTNIKEMSKGIGYFKT